MTDHPTPWRYKKEHGERVIVDDNGERVMFSLDSDELAKEIVARVNASAKKAKAA